MDRGVRIIVRETFHSSLRLTEQVLAATGLDADEAARTVETFRAHDEQRLLQSSHEAAQELRSLFEADKEERPTAQPGDGGAAPGRSSTGGRAPK